MHNALVAENVIANLASGEQCCIAEPKCVLAKQHDAMQTGHEKTPGIAKLTQCASQALLHKQGPQRASAVHSFAALPRYLAMLFSINCRTGGGP